MVFTQNSSILHWAVHQPMLFQVISQSVLTTFWAMALLGMPFCYLYAYAQNVHMTIDTCLLHGSMITWDGCLLTAYAQNVHMTIDTCLLHGSMITWDGCLLTFDQHLGTKKKWRKQVMQNIKNVTRWRDSRTAKSRNLVEAVTTFIHVAAYQAPILSMV